MILEKTLETQILPHLVNFRIIQRYFISKNLDVENIITQSQFLQKMGI